MKINTGCYIDGGQYTTWEQVSEVLDILDMFNPTRALELRIEYDDLDPDDDAAHALADLIMYDAIDVLNRSIPAGYSAGWYEGDFFISHESEEQA